MPLANFTVLYISVCLKQCYCIPSCGVTNSWWYIYNLTCWQAAKSLKEANTVSHGGPQLHLTSGYAGDSWKRKRFLEALSFIRIAVRLRREVSHRSPASCGICDSWALATFYFSVSVEAACLSDGARPPLAFPWPPRSAETCKWQDWGWNVLSFTPEPNWKIWPYKGVKYNELAEARFNVT